MAFDYAAARKAGYSDAEIADHLSQGALFDAAAARKAGYSDAEIVQHLQAKEAQRAARDSSKPAQAAKPAAAPRQSSEEATRLARGAFGKAAPVQQDGPAAAAVKPMRPENPLDVARRQNADVSTGSMKAATAGDLIGGENRGENIDVAHPGAVYDPGESWGETGSKIAKHIIPGFKASLGGAIQGMAENQSDVIIGPDGMAQRITLPEGLPDGPTPGEAMQREAAADLAGTAFRPGDNLAKYYAGQLADSLIQMVPSIAATIATRSPGVGMGTMFGQVGGQQYGESRNEGRSKEQASVDALYMGVTEILGEKLVLGRILAPGGGKLLGETLKTAGMESAQEMVTQVLQTGYEAGVLKHDMTLGEAMRTVIDAGILGAGMGTAMHVAGHPFKPKAEVGADGRITSRAPDDTRVAPAGVRQTAEATAATPTQADIDSPLDTADIVAGRTQIAKAEGSKKADTALQQHGLPTIGARVVVDMGDGVQHTGSMEDWFEADDGKGVVVKLDNGKTIREYTDTLADAGVSIRPESPLAEADALDAELAAQAAKAPVLPVAEQSSPVSSPATSAAPVAGPTPNAGAAPSVAIDNFMAKTRRAESGGDDNAKNPRSSASGRYQFTDKTWIITFRAEYPGDRKSDEEILALKGDAATQERLMRRLTKDNAAALARGGHDVTEGNLYLAHFAGSGGANALLNANPNASAESVLGAGVIKANPFLKGKTAGEVVAWAAGKMGGAAPAIGRSAFDQAPSAKPEDIAFSDPEFTGVKPLEIERRDEPAADLAGKKIDEEWTTFKPETGTLGIPRADMPQIKAELRGAMVNFLNARGISHEEVRVPASSLKPSQAEFSPAKVEKAQQYEGGDRAILISSDGHVVDGHHQWLAAREAGVDVRAIQLNAPIRDALAAAHEFPSSTTAEGATDAQTPAQTDKASEQSNLQETQSAPASQVSFEDTPSGKGFAVIGASPAELAAIASQVPQAKASQRKDGAQVYSAKWAAEIRAAVAGVSQAAAPTEGAGPAGAPAFSSASADLQNGDAVGFEASDGWTQVRQIGRDLYEIDKGSTVQEVPGSAVAKIADREGWTRSGRSRAEAQAEQRVEGRREFAKRSTEEHPGLVIKNPRTGEETTIHPAGTAGGRAYLDGKDRVPPAEMSTEDKKRWLAGWDKANLAAPAPDAEAERQRKMGAKQSPAEKAAGVKLRDWSNTVIPAWDEQGARGDFDGGPTKDAFLADAKAYLKAVADILAADGFAGKPETKGKKAGQPRNPVSVNEGGPASSGDVYLEMYPPEGQGTGVYVNIGTAMATPKGGISLMARTIHPTTRGSGVNNWWPVDLSAADMADRLKKLSESERRDAKPVDRSAAIIMDPAAGTVKTVPLGNPEKKAWSNPEAFIRIAADDVSALRKADVERVIREAPAESREMLGDYIAEKRPDLAEEVRDVQQELAQPAAPATPPPTLDLKPTDQATIDLLARMAEAEDNGRHAPIDSGTQRVQMMIREGLILEGKGNVAYVTSEKGRAALDAAGVAHAQAPKAQPSKNRLVTDERAAELRDRLKAKLNPNRLNSGIDPEVLAIGTELAVYHIEKGARRFAALARAVAADLDTPLAALRTYLRGWYNGARDMMEDHGESVAGMDDSEEVAKAMRTFDQWAETPVTPPAADDTRNRDVELPNGLSASDARPGADNVSRAPQDRGDERAPRREGGRSPQTVQPVDGERGAPAERGAGEPAGRSGSDRAGLRDADNLSGKRDADSRVTGTDWAIEPGSLAEDRSPAQKARDNVDAIALVKQIEREGRPATREEQAKIARYVGWGGLKNAFPDSQGEYGKGFEKIGPELRDLLTDAEYETARRSIQYAHYTGETVVRSMWDIAERLGFRGGSVFEPGMGTGNFRGMMPAHIAAASHYNGLEYDHLTASIAKLLYPQSGVQQADYTRTPQLMGVADLVIGNPPFSETTVASDPAYAAHRFVLHDFFFAKSLDAVKPGGLLMFVTSAGTMNKVGDKARAWLADRADLVGAIRLPGNTFEKNAGTSVTTDIVILRKRMEGEAAGDRAWVETGIVPLKDRDGNPLDGAVNRYFIANPEMILGEQGMFDKLVAGPRYAVRAPAGFDLGAALKAAADRLPASILNNAPSLEPLHSADVDFGSGQTKDGSYYVDPDGRLMQYRNGVGRAVQAPGKGVTGGMSAAAQERVRGLVPVRDALRDVYRADVKDDVPAGDKAREALNKAYDAFVAKFGPINKTEISYRAPTSIQLESARAEAREEARLAGTEWEEGSFDIEPYLDRGASITEIARERKAAREAAIAAGRRWEEGTFNPEDVPETVIEKRPNLDPFIEDEESYRLAAVEHYNKDTGQAAKGKAFFENAVRLDRKPVINSAQDALLYSLNRLGRPDIGVIADMSGKSQGEVLEELQEQLFEVPGQPGAYETAEVYLSGNVRDKLAIAQTEAQRNPALTRNVKALEAALPAPLTPTEIAANLGMPWIPTSDIEQFVTGHLGLASAKVKYLPKLAQWTAAGDTYSAAARSTWGTQRMHAMDLLEAALNRQTPQVHDRTEDGKRVLNAVATQAAQDKMAEIKAAFRDWIWKDDARAERLTNLYNETYNSLVAPKFDGSYLTTPGIASGWEWRPHQRAVIARIIQAGNTYMAHEVGAGKTSAMIGAGMEMKRLGLVSKPMYVVPNHMLGQFTKEFYEQYPLAKIRVADETRFHTSRRKEFVARMAADDLDAVIITHSAFGYIPMSDDFVAGMIDDQIAELEDVLAEIGKDQDQRVTRRKIEQQKEALEQRLKGLSNRKRDQVFTFEETGVDFLFVDEAHLFRKLDFATKMGNVKGIDPNGSAMSFDLYSKTRHLEDVHPGRNLVLASGTPITNTMAELYSVSRYLQQSELDKRQLGHFDAWAGAFGDTVTSLEQDPAGGYKPVTRFAQFVNVPELSVMVRQVMDVVGAAELRQYVTLPTLKGGARQMVLAQQTDSQEAYGADLQVRMEKIRARKGPPSKGDDILLSVINDGRKAAIDYRLIDPMAPKEAGSKLEMLIDNLHERHKEFARTPFHTPGKPEDGYSAKPVNHGPATQMVFSNLGINGAFPVHKYIKQQLISRGVPANQVAIISDYKSHVAKQRLFNDMNEGKVRVLIGSVAKMGTGVNAQRRLRAVHNMDALWFPADDTQRNGRIIRQGNMNPEIEILDYSTKGTYDSQMWNLMAKKAKFIEGFMRGDPTMRDMEDLGEASQYEQAQAMTTSDPRIMELTEWKQELEKLERRRVGHDREKQTIRSRIAYAGQTIEGAKRLIPLIEQDIAKRVLPVGEDFTATAGGQTFDDRAEFGAALLEAMDALTERANGKEAREGVGEIGGFAIVAETHPGIDGPVPSFIIKRAGGRETVVRGPEDSRGLVTKLVNALKKFDSELAYEKSSQAGAEREIADYTPRLATTFDGGPQIEALRGQISGMETTLDTETKAREAAAKAAPAPTEAPKDSVADEEAKDRIPSASDLAALRTDLKARLAGLGLAGKVQLNVVDALTGRAEGRYWPGRRVIEVLLGAKDAGFILDHEAIHALRDMGVFTATDWKILTTAARNTADLWRSINQRYAQLDLAAREEEAVADLFARYQRGDFAPKGMVERLFIRLVKLLAAARNAFRGQGFTTPRTFFEVLDEVASGKAATREGQGEAGKAFVPAFGRKGESGKIGGPKNAADSAGQIDEAKFSIPERDDMVALGGSDGTWGAKMGDAFDRWRTAMQDRYLPLLKVQREIEAQTGQSLPPSRNPYMGEELMTGRIGARLEALADEQVGPLFDAMHEAGISVDELETYLYARHAPERNARMSELNPAFEEGEGSGMTDLEARAVMNRIRADGKAEAMQRLAERVDRIISQALDYRVETGLMSEAQAKEWRDTYQHYIPLRGFKETGGDPIPERINRSGGGINVRGRESKAAYGRRSKADSPLAYIILQAEEAIVRGETNLVAQKFVALAKANPDPDFWKVNKTSTKQRINEDSGLVETYLTHNLTAEDADWTVSAKIDGKQVRVTMNKGNAAARRLADSMKNLTQHQLDWITLHLGKVNRFLSAVNTSWNPEFVITNAFRDIQTAAFNLAGEDVPKLERGVLKDWLPAMKASTKGAFGKGEGDWGKWYDEFVSNGGRVYFNQVEDVAGIKKRIKTAFDMAGARRGEGGVMLQTKRGLFAVKDFVDNLNNGVENAVRLATYKNARELGLTPAQAASMAKNVTVNFNRRGTMGPAMNAAYLFFNASVQGTTRIFQAMRSPRVRKMMAGVMLASAMVEMLNAFVSDDDDDGESFYDKIPAFEKGRNMIFMLPGGREYIKIPMPYGYNVFWNAGRSATEIARRGGDRAMETSAQFLADAFDAFNPVGGAQSLLNMIAPTIADPIVDITTNTDFTGRKIMPDQPAYGPPEPDNTRYWGSVGTHWRAVSTFLNDVSGGDDVLPGAIDVSPETLEYMSGTVIGAAGGFLDRLAKLGGKVWTGDDVETNDLPFARKVVGGKPGWYDKSAYYDRIAAVDLQVQYAKNYIEAENMDEARAFVDSEEKILSLEPTVKAAKREMRAIRKARKANDAAFDRGKIDKAAHDAEKDVVDQAEKIVVTQFNTRWNEVMTGGD